MSLEGTVTVELDGEEVPLKLTWASFSKLEQELGPDWVQKISAAAENLDPKTLAIALSVASGRSVDWWMEKSPPFILMASSLNRAVLASFYGTSDKDKAEKRAKALAQEAGDAKKDPPKGRGWLKRLTSRF